MMSSALWAELKQLAEQPLSLRQQFAADPKRAEKFQVIPSAFILTSPKI